MSRALLASRLSDEAHAFEFAERALALAERSGNHRAAALALGQMAWSHYANGRATAALEHAQRAVERVHVARREGTMPLDEHTPVQLLILHAIIEQDIGSLRQARRTCNEALAMAREAGWRRPQVSTLETLGSLEMIVGRPAQALADFGACAELADEIGAAGYSTSARLNMARCHVELAQTAAAFERLAEAEAAAERGDLRELMGRCQLLRGHLETQAGEAEAARDALDRAVTIFESIDNAALRCQARSAQAALHLAQGRLVPAQQLVEQIAADLAGGLSLVFTDEPLRPRLVCHRVWLAVGDARAHEAIDTVHAELLANATRADDEATRIGMLRDVALSREIVAAWEATRAPW